MSVTMLIVALMTWQLDPRGLFENFDSKQTPLLAIILANSVPEGDRRTVRKYFSTQPQLFSYLQQLRETRSPRVSRKELQEALDAEIERRVLRFAPRWKDEARIDFLTECAVLRRYADVDTAKECGQMAAAIAKKVVAKHRPVLIDPLNHRKEQPRGVLTLWFNGLEKRLPDLTVTTDLEVHNNYNHIGLYDKLVVDTFERYGLLCLRDGLFVKHQKLNRGRITLDSGIILSNGPIALDQCCGSVVICDGEIRFETYFVDNSLLISNDSIRSQESLGGNSTWIARRKISDLGQTSTKGSILIAGEEIDIVKRKGGEFGTHIVGKDKFDPGVRFFAVADVGLELKEVDGKVIVKAVAQDSPFRKSLKPGDRINSINDKFFQDFDDCRRKLREACVIGYGFVNRTRDGGHARVLVDLLGYPKPLKAK